MLQIRGSYLYACICFFQIFREIKQKICLILMLVPIPTTLIEAILSRIKKTFFAESISKKNSADFRKVI